MSTPATQPALISPAPATAVPVPDSAAAANSTLPYDPAQAQQLIQDMKDIADIRDPLQLDIAPWVWGAGMAAIIAAALCIWLFIRWYRSRKPRSTPEPLIPPHEKALSQLSTLRALPHLSAREICFSLTALLKEYIHGKFGIEAQEMTTEEFLPALDRLGRMTRPIPAGPETDSTSSPTTEIHLVPADHILHLKQFVRQADPIKYAGRDTDNETLFTYMNQIEQFIHATTTADTSSVLPSGLQGLTSQGKREEPDV